MLNSRASPNDPPRYANAACARMNPVGSVVSVIPGGGAAGGRLASPSGGGAGNRAEVKVSASAPTASATTTRRARRIFFKPLASRVHGRMASLHYHGATTGAARLIAYVH